MLCSFPNFIYLFIHFYFFFFFTVDFFFCKASHGIHFIKPSRRNDAQLADRIGPSRAPGKWVLGGMGKGGNTKVKGMAAAQAGGVCDGCDWPGEPECHLLHLPAPREEGVVAPVS